MNYLQIYSYYEKGRRKKCTRQSRKVLWMVLSSMLFKTEFETLAQEAMDVCLRVLKESNKSRLDSFSFRNSVRVLIIFSVACTFRQPFSKQLYIKLQVYQMALLTNVNQTLAQFGPSEQNFCESHFTLNRNCYRTKKLRLFPLCSYLQLQLCQ